ncbi:hypothetical protein QLL95_gp0706 [Cotonvirus japonicus]|uniref:Uncharacterized protein n=1 Tax=Cotonvirus japonicus TaxID=2811091 RepID=A0ABM7NTM5_9VIRU|nr:hypothetical protein QLL95_gp0706 [Cotonvirus japonicus]BCS83417.1 hypothetical protein [Cotonvirus japonicus]
MSFSKPKSLPRNTFAKNINRHRKLGTVGLLTKKLAVYDSICKKHSVGSLTFRNCKVASNSGKSIIIDHEEIRGNMKCGVLLVKAISVYDSQEIYDVVQVKLDKEARIEKKRQEDFEKSKQELERLKKAGDINFDENDTNHKNLVNELMKKLDETTNNEINRNESQETNNNESQETNTNESQETNNNESQETINNESQETNTNESQETNNNEFIENNTDESLEKISKETQQKKHTRERNKYYRNFMRDFKSKFSIKLQPDYNFFEGKVETTDMIIENSIVYEIDMNVNQKTKYFLVVGDLQLKSGLLRQIDPMYKSESVVEEQNEFIERIKAKEDIKIQESDADVLESESDNDDIDNGIVDVIVNNNDS